MRERKTRISNISSPEEVAAFQAESKEIAAEEAVAKKAADNLALGKTEMVFGQPMTPETAGQLLSANRGYLAELRSMNASRDDSKFLARLRREGTGGMS